MAWLDGAMGKAGKARKRRRGEAEAAAAALSVTKGTAVTRVHDEAHQAYGPGVCAADVAAATRVLTAMAEAGAGEMDRWRGREFKGLRAALHALRQSEWAGMVLGFGKRAVSETQVVGDALRDGRLEDASAALDAMRARGVVPKLGAVCRWVRDCDAIGTGRDQGSLGKLFPILDLILRTADPGQVGAMRTPKAISSLPGGAAGLGVLPAEGGGLVRVFPPWAPPSPPLPPGGQPLPPLSPPPEPEGGWVSGFRVCQHTPAAERMPPNVYDLHIRTSAPGVVALDDGPGEAAMAEVPFLPDSFVVCGAFSRAECARVVAAGEAVGFEPDEPAGGSATEKQSVLAHAFVWCVDRPLADAFWRDRIRPNLPPHLAGRAVGLNRRWRVYRYVHGAAYRIHIDGAWPGSGLDGDGAYVYDAFGDGTWSQMTCLIYLNDGFEGGETKFYIPSPVDPSADGGDHERGSHAGSLDCRGVVPTAGAALFFPHGSAGRALLHEGSGVAPGGVKYVVRTDLLFRPADVAAAS